MELYHWSSFSNCPNRTQSIWIDPRRKQSKWAILLSPSNSPSSSPSLSHPPIASLPLPFHHSSINPFHVRHFPPLPKPPLQTCSPFSDPNPFPQKSTLLLLKNSILASNFSYPFPQMGSRRFLGGVFPEGAWGVRDTGEEVGERRMSSFGGRLSRCWTWLALLWIPVAIQELSIGFLTQLWSK